MHFPRLSILHRIRQGTINLANRFAFIIDMHEEIVITRSPQHLETGIPADALSADVPKHDHALAINKIYGIL
jgi:hypothetical protein